MIDPKFELLEAYADIALESNLRIKGGPVAIHYGTDHTEFVLYFGFSDGKSNGSNMVDGWSSFAFIANRELTDSTKGERIVGRRLISGRKETFRNAISKIPNIKVGKFDALRNSADDDLPFVFTTDLLPGTWAIVRDRKSSKKVERVWLLRKK